MQVGRVYSAMSSLESAAAVVWKSPQLQLDLSEFPDSLQLSRDNKGVEETARSSNLDLGMTKKDELIANLKIVENIGRRSHDMIECIIQEKEDTRAVNKDIGL